MLEFLDTTIVNVAIPHIQGNMGAILEDVAWVSTGYAVANVIICPCPDGWEADLEERIIFCFPLFFLPLHPCLLRKLAYPGRTGGFQNFTRISRRRFNFYCTGYFIRNLAA